MRSRPLGVAAVAVAVLSSMAGLAAPPAAWADDPLPPIRGAVNAERSKTVCPALT